MSVLPALVVDEKPLFNYLAVEDVGGVAQPPDEAAQVVVQLVFVVRVLFQVVGESSDLIGYQRQ